MYDDKVHVGVAVQLLEIAGNMLLLKRSEDASHGAGTWGAPGGWIQDGETAEEAAIRELQEEVGVEVDHNELILLDVVANKYPDKDMHVICVWFSVLVHHDIKFKNREPDKHSEVAWREPFAMYQENPHELFPPLGALVERSIYPVRVIGQ